MPGAQDSGLILLAEDNDNLRYMTMLQLKKLGYKPHYARDGKEATTMVEQFQYQVILMDIMMPAMDGCEATLAIREIEKTLGRAATPIIAMTAFEDKSRCIEAGMDDYLFKPVLLEDLKNKLDFWTQEITPRRNGTG